MTTFSRFAAVDTIRTSPILLGVALPLLLVLHHLDPLTSTLLRISSLLRLPISDLVTRLLALWCLNRTHKRLCLQADIRLDDAQPSHFLVEISIAWIPFNEHVGDVLDAILAERIDPAAESIGSTSACFHQEVVLLIEGLETYAMLAYDDMERFRGLL